MTKKEEKKIKKRLFNKCSKLMSLYIRKRADGICFTCGKEVGFKKLNAGHFRHGILDFSSINRQAQCVSCNKFKHGRLDVFARNIIGKYGIDEFICLFEKRDEYTIGYLEFILSKLEKYIEKYKL